MKTVRFFPPVLTPLLSNKKLCRAIAGFSIMHLAIVSLGLPSWPCPIRYGLGFPCPGCGLTRAIKALGMGNWQRSVATHAFAPLAALVLILIGYVSIAPVSHWDWILQRCRQIEQKTGLSVLFIMLFMVYWLVRLLFFRKAFYHWVL